MQNDPAHLLGPTVRILGAVIDAVVAYGSLTDEALAQIDSVILREQDTRRGRSKTKKEVLLEELGVQDQYGIYSAAGLNDIQAEIAFLHYDRLASPAQIARFTGREIVNVRAHLYEAERRILRLGRAAKVPL